MYLFLFLVWCCKYFWIRRPCLGAFQKLLSIGFSCFICTSEVTPQLFANILQYFPSHACLFFLQLWALHLANFSFLFASSQQILAKKIFPQIWWVWGIIRDIITFEFLFLQICLQNLSWSWFCMSCLPRTQQSYWQGKI